MRILYGVQGTGNGHITRARAMAPALAAQGAEVDFVFSGRPGDKFFDMQPFGDYALCTGLTMVTEGGRIRALKTLTRATPGKFFREVRTLNTRNYDLILTDFEPVTAWAGRLCKTPVLGLGHQYAFRYAIPQHYGGPHHQLIMKYFAPTPASLGFHWYHFDMPILPPIAPVLKGEAPICLDSIVVYLPFETPGEIETLLAPFSDYQFQVFHPEAKAARCDHIRWFQPSREGFQQALESCNGVICNAGFELASEVLQLGRKLLVKPVAGQSEQLSNALALRLIGLGYTMPGLDADVVRIWLREGRAVRVRYPDVAGEVARWITNGCFDDNSGIERLANRLWRQTRFPSEPLFTTQEIEEFAIRP